MVVFMMNSFNCALMNFIFTGRYLEQKPNCFFDIEFVILVFFKIILQQIAGHAILCHASRVLATKLDYNFCCINAIVSLMREEKIKRFKNGDEVIAKGTLYG